MIRAKYLFLLLMLVCCTVDAQVITTFAGNDTAGFGGDNGPATAAKLSGPRFAKMDASGNLYIADYANNRVRKVNSTGIITTVAGNGTAIHSGDGGPATAAGVSSPQSIALDKYENLFIVEGISGGEGKWIRKVSLSGVITTIAGKNDTIGYSGDGYPAIAAGFENIADIAIDHTGNIYVTDFGASRVRKINGYSVITTIAGNGTYGYSGDADAATAAQLSQPMGIAVDATGNLYISDQANNCVRKIDTSGIISTIAGKGPAGFSGDGGPAAMAELSSPTGIAVDGEGTVYIADFGNNRVRIVKDGIITTLTGDGNWGYGGDGGLATAAELSVPMGVFADASRNVYIGDIGNNVIRKITNENVGIIDAGIEMKSDLHLWPQPNDGIFTVLVSSATDAPVHINIANAVGQKIKEVSVWTNRAAELNLDVPNGLYFLSATTDNSRQITTVAVRK
jgi:NHL repeat-containing protein